MNLTCFVNQKLFDATNELFAQLGIILNSNTEQALNHQDILKDRYKDRSPFKDIEKIYFSGLVEDSFCNTATDNDYQYEDAVKIANKKYGGLMLFSIELNITPNRSQIAELTRVFNQKSQKMPVGLLLKYGNKISIALPERFKYLQDWRPGEKVGKVIILRDINTEKPHAGHLRILEELAKHNAKNFNELHAKWLEALDINILNKKFYAELSNWYFWAMDIVKFPDDTEKNKEIRNSTNLIRLITRIIFIWFVKEKGLIPENLFDEKQLKNIIKNFGGNNYYNAILQNLFFGTLNQTMGKDRGFISDKSHHGKNQQYNVTTRYRYPELFNITEKEAVSLFKNIPFLNGGLFDCLDRPDENGNNVVRIDGFSTTPKKRAVVPDSLFFGTEQEIDLNNIYDTKNKTYKCKGLINILNSYKFTITENTSSEEDVALDPELLGKVFENLLASYNPETKTTARKQTGSFYTPREIVDYMVNESLTTHLKEKVGVNWEHNERTITALNNIKILDPACGSGAFPMGILHKMVQILQTLDPDNKYWREVQKQKAISETEKAYNIGDREEREKRLKEISDIFENNASDYGRKLFLIENCIFGVDIQPIAIQISKLRFFLSLVIEQEIDESKDNLGIRPLPNLETKFVAANTLIGLDKSAQLSLGINLIEPLENELKQVRHEYFTANNRRKKLDLQKKDKKLREELAKLLKDIGYAEKSADNIAIFDPYNQNVYAEWFDSEWMFGLTQGFDIVIGNPPYVSAPTMVDTNPKERKAIIDSKRFTALYQKWDLYIPFMEIGLQLLAENGMFTMIVPYPLTNQTYAKKLRELIIDQYNLLEIVDLNGTKVFENATVSNCIPFISKSESTDGCFISQINEQKQIIRIFEQSYSDLVQNENTAVWNLTTEKRETSRHSKMNILGDFCYISVGMVLNADEKNARGEFTKDDLISETYDAVHCRKYIEAKDIERYQVKNIRYLEYNTNRCPNKLRRPTFKELYENPKLMFNRLGNLMVYYDEKTKFLHSDSMFSGVLWKDLKDVENKSITSSIKRYSRYSRKEMEGYSEKIDLRYLLGILNSRYACALLSNLRGGDYHIYPEHLRNLPIPDISLDRQQPIIDLVDQILSVKKKNPAANTADLESEIDRLVYELYGLNEDEIEIIGK